MSDYHLTVATSTAAVIAGALVAFLAPPSIPAMVIACGLSGAGLITGVFNTLSMNLATIREAKAVDPDASFGSWAVAYGATVALAAAAVGAIWWKAVMG